MNIKEQFFFGVDIVAGAQPFTVTVLDQKCSLFTCAHGQTEDVMELIKLNSPSLIAVTTPSSVNKGFMKKPEVRRCYSPPPRKDQWTDLRTAEYEMHLAGLHISRTPSIINNCTSQVRQGFILYQYLQEVGYQTYPTPDVVNHWMEVPAEAGFQMLFKGKTLLKPKTLEGRIQRQLLLFDHKLGIPDPMFFFEEVTRYRLLHGILPFENLYSTSELYALIAAYTAWLAINDPSQVSYFGIPQENLIFLPGKYLGISNPKPVITPHIQPMPVQTTLFQNLQTD